MNLRKRSQQRALQRRARHAGAKPHTMVLHMFGDPWFYPVQRKRTTHVYGAYPINPGTPLEAARVSAQIKYEHVLRPRDNAVALARVIHAQQQRSVRFSRYITRLQDGVVSPLAEMMGAVEAEQKSSFRTLLRDWMGLVKRAGEPISQEPHVFTFEITYPGGPVDTVVARELL